MEINKEYLITSCEPVKYTTAIINADWKEMICTQDSETIVTLTNLKKLILFEEKGNLTPCMG